MQKNIDINDDIKYRQRKYLLSSDDEAVKVAFHFAIAAAMGMFYFRRRWQVRFQYPFSPPPPTTAIFSV